MRQLKPCLVPTSMFLLVATSYFILAACANKKTTTTAENNVEKNIPYQIAKNYFVKNNYANQPLHAKLVSTQKAFQEIIGGARIAAENGQPTPIKFESQSVIAIIGESLSEESTIVVQKLSKTGKTINVHCLEKKGEKQTFVSRNMLLLVIDKTNVKKLQLVCATEKQTN